jgi:hypothetical protein
MFVNEAEKAIGDFTGCSGMKSVLLDFLRYEIIAART